MAQWTTPMVASVKAAVKVELDAVPGFGPGKRRVRLDFALAQARRLEDATTSVDRLRCFVYLISALVHHERFGGLPPRQVGRIAKLASAILLVERVPTKKSRLSFLHGEVQIVLSQIARRQGDAWKAAWQFEAALLATRASPLMGDAAYRALATAIRALRLGQAQYALVNYSRSETLTENPKHWQLARIGRIRSLRLAGELERSAALSLDTLTRSDLTLETKNELAWEEVCRQVTGEGDLAPMLAAVQLGQAHEAPSYFLEAMLWAKAAPQRQWDDKLPSIRMLDRRLKGKPKAGDFLYSAVAQLERSEDTTVPILFRLERLGEILANRQALLSIDKELLLLAASCRWLARVAAFSLATLTLNEYTALSMKLSNGAQRDVLNLVHDIQERPWATMAAEDDRPELTETG